MNDQTAEPAATPPPPPPPPPSPSTAADDGKASGGMRALGVVLALVLAFGAAVMIIAAGDINDTAPCDDPAAVLASGEDECFDGSDTKQSITVGLMYAGGVLAALSVLAGLALAITGRRGRLFAQIAIAAVAISALGILIGSV
jgi:hypothetical protein